MIDLRTAFMKMAKDEPEELLQCSRVVQSPGLLTFIAEALGEIGDAGSEPLLRLLGHDRPVVREGALLGLSARQMNPAEIEAVRTVASDDKDKDIREIAQSILVDPECMPNMACTNGKEIFYWEVVQDNKLGRAVEFYTLLSPKTTKALLFRAKLPVDTSPPYFEQRFDLDTLDVIRGLV